MPAYLRSTVPEFASADPNAIVGTLETRYANDGFATQFLAQPRAWADLVPKLQAQLRQLMSLLPASRLWTILVEYPLYRLRKRVDMILLAESMIVVVEVKVGERRFLARQKSTLWISAISTKAAVRTALFQSSGRRKLRIAT